MKPQSIRYRLNNKDAYGRITELAIDKKYDGKITYDIQTLPANQLDDGQRMYGLTIAQLVELGELAKEKLP